MPRGGDWLGDDTVAEVIKARECDGLEAFTEGSDGEPLGPLLIRADMCVVMQQALQRELLLACGSKGMS